jgi:Tfp pilus assembly protein PilV
MRLHSQKHEGRAARVEAGFTILETVIALFVALIVGLGAISLFLFSASFNAGASDRARALALAQERMERLRGRPFAELAETDTTETVTLGETTPGNADARTFTVRTRVVPDPAVPDDKQFVITVTVTPVPIGGRFTAREVTLVMLRGSEEFAGD